MMEFEEREEQEKFILDFMKEYNMSDRSLLNEKALLNVSFATLIKLKKDLK